MSSGIPSESARQLGPRAVPRAVSNKGGGSPHGCTGTRGRAKAHQSAARKRGAGRTAYTSSPHLKLSRGVTHRAWYRRASIITSILPPASTLRWVDVQEHTRRDQTRARTEWGHTRSSVHQPNGARHPPNTVPTLHLLVQHPATYSRTYTGRVQDAVVKGGKLPTQLVRVKDHGNDNAHCH